ncbi:MAG: O-antigen polymerase [Cetobacterium sp.]
MSRKRLFKVIIFSIFISFLGFIFNVSIPGKLPLNKMGSFLRVIAFLTQIILYLGYNKINKKDLGFIFLALIFFILKKEKMIIYSLQIYLIIMLLKNYNLKKVFKSFEKISIIGLGIIYLNNILGISSSRVYYGIYDGVLKNRNTYGIVTPNILFGIFLCYIFFRSLNKSDIKNYIFLMLLSTLGYISIISRNGYYISLLYLMVQIIINKLNKTKSKILLSLLSLTSLFSIFLIIFSKYILNKSVFDILNLKLSNRLYLFNIFLNKVNTSDFFGLTLVEFNLPLDSSYIRLFNYFGIFVVIFFIMILFKVNYKVLSCGKKNTYNQLSFLIFVTIYYNFEAFMLNGGYLISIGYFLIIYKFIYYRKRKRLNGDENEKGISYSPSL